jgi:hypothetical protein
MNDIRLPNITAPTEAQKIQQIADYLFQLARQLNVILDDIDKKNSELESKINEFDSTLKSKGVI